MFLKNRHTYILKLLSCLLCSIVFVISIIASTEQNNKVAVTIFQTSDIHANFDLSKESNSFLLPSVLFQAIKEQGGRQNCLIIDCGDAFQGSLEGMLTKGDITVRLLNYLGYNIFVPGNHDFDFGTETFVRNINDLNCDVLAANLKLDQAQKKIAAWKIYKVNDEKIAVIGMTFPYLNHYFWGKKYDGFRVSSMTDALANIMPDVLKEKPDLIVLCMHYGMHTSHRHTDQKNDIRKMIRKYPQIDLVLAGHTHKQVSGELIGHALYVQPASHAKYIAKVVITFQKDTKKITSSLIPVKKMNNEKLSLPFATTILKRSESFGNKAIPIDKNRITFRKIFIGDLICRSMKFITNANIAICGTVNKDIFLNLEDNCILYRNIFYAYPYEDTVVIMYLTKDELLQVIKEQISANINKGESFAIRGLQTKYDHEDFIQVFQSQIEKLKTNPSGKIAVTFRSYDISGAGGRYRILRKITEDPNVKKIDTGILVRDAIVKYIRKDMD